MALSSYVKGKQVTCALRRWTREFLDETEQFPDGAHDDQVDAVSGAFNFLMLGRQMRLLV
jgi:predicted phage terminase large subunit-like protein